MKKKISILIILTLIFNIVINAFVNISFGALNNKKENGKKNPESYWSTKNSPLFYGATKITLRKDIIDDFDVLDTRFRIFAKDFEDGELTPKITHSEDVNVNEVGNYEIKYSVTDSHNNVSTLTVPVIVTDDENAKINVERTLYTTPSVWNMDMAEFSRCNYGDRQILGVYLSTNQSIRARVLNADNNITVNFLNNDEYNETSKVLPNTGEWITLENVKNNISYSNVPLLKTTVLSRQNTEINKTFKIELEYDENINPLNYYHYLDNEENFKSKWLKSQDNYAVIESESLTLVVPITDVPYMTNYYNNGFTSLDKFLEYYQKVVEKMDEYVGLDFNPEKITDQNVRTKYLVKANVHGIGAAYYAGDHVGVNNSSMRSFFEMNWGGLHELAHGYQGSLGKGEMLLGEVANNILGHYIQIDKSIYFHQGNWLGNLPDIEEGRNEQRLNGKTFLEVDEPTRLYVIINLFNTFEGGTTYGKMFSWYREQLDSGRRMTNQDAYVEAIADIYNINIIPYMEAWGLNISDLTKSNVYQKNYPLINILKDMVQEGNLNQIMTNEGFDRKYSLVTNEVLQKYGITSNMILNIEIDDFSKLANKVVLLKHGNDTVKSIKINEPTIFATDVPVGTYYLQMPIVEGYSQEYVYVQIKEGQDENTIYSYQKQADVDYGNYLKMQVLGYNYDTIAYQLIFKDSFSKAEISYPNQSGMSGNEYIKIYNAEGSLVTEDVSTGGYFEYSKGTHEIDLGVGYVIEVKYPNKYANKVKVFSTLTGNLLPEYNATDTITRYIVIENGLIREGMDEELANDLAYEQLKPSLIEIIERYRLKVTDVELNNKFINFKEKAEVVDAYSRLRENDKIPYTSLITAIKKGGSPIVTAKQENLEYKVGEKIDLYNLITAVDNEDGVIVIDKTTTIIDTKLNTDIAGNYDVIYKVSDSDNNVTTKILKIEIIDDTLPEEKPELPDEEETPKPEEKPEIPDGDNTEKPEVPGEDDNQQPEEEPDVPGEDDNQEPEIPDNDNQNPDDENTKPETPEEDDTEEPDIKPDVPVDDEVQKPEPTPELPTEDNIQKPVEQPEIPIKGNNSKVEDALIVGKSDHQASMVIENNSEELDEVVLEETSQNDNIVNSLEEIIQNTNDENQENLNKEIDHTTISNTLPDAGNKLTVIIKVIVILVLISLLALFIIRKKINRK